MKLTTTGAFVVAVVVLCHGMCGDVQGGPVHVSGYTRANGTHVAPYTRSLPRTSPGYGYGGYGYGGYNPGPAPGIPNIENPPPPRPVASGKTTATFGYPGSPGTTVITPGASQVIETRPASVETPKTVTSGPGTGANMKKVAYLHSYVNSSGVTVWEYRYRSAPDDSFNNNWSTKGNVNPVTNQPGTKVTPPK